MDPTLLSAIQDVEHEYGSLDNPKADLSNVHYIVKKLGLFGNHKRVGKNRIWFINNEYITFNPKLIKIYYLLLDKLPVSHIKQIVHVDPKIVRNVRNNIVDKHQQLKLMSKDSVLSIVG